MPQSRELTVKTEMHSHEEALAAERSREPAADGQNDGVRDQIGSQHPGAFVVAGAQVSGHVRQGHVGDAGVEHLHEGGQRDDDGDQPGIVLGLPDVLVERDCAQRTHLSIRPGTTFMPGRRR